MILSRGNVSTHKGRAANLPIKRMIRLVRVEPDGNAPAKKQGPMTTIPAETPAILGKTGLFQYSWRSPFGAAAAAEGRMLAQAVWTSFGESPNLPAAIFLVLPLLTGGKRPS